MGNKNYKLFLYKPAAANYAVDTSDYRAEFLGELKADNVSASIKLQEISTLSFTLPENILGTFNTRLDEVLDNYVVELWYGDLTGATLGSDYFPTTGDRVRFIITNSRLVYSDGVKTYSFEANSIEYILEFKQLINWPGIKIKDFYRTISYDAVSNNFEETGQSDYTISTSTNTARTKYITVPTTTAGSTPPSPFDIFIYQYRRNDTDTVNSENSVIEFSGAVNDEGFKPGFYVPTLDGNGKVTAVAISLPVDIEEFDAAGKNFEIFLYDNPLSRHFAIGINTDDDLEASDMYLEFAQNETTQLIDGAKASIIENTNNVSLKYSTENLDFLATVDVGTKIIGTGIPDNTRITEVTRRYGNGFPKSFTISNNYTGATTSSLLVSFSKEDDYIYNGFTFTSQAVYSINGLKLEDILLGTQNPRTNNEIDNSKLTVDGILYDTGFTIGTIHEDIAAKYRSNIELNNITKYEAIKNLAESFDAIAVFDTITKTVSFYPDKNEEVFPNNGLIITKNNYLKSINNDINATKIVTKVYGAGKDNLGLELITPNGNAAWEDYSYFLDTYYVEYDRTSLETMSYNETTGVAFTGFPTGTLSRWMESGEALKLAQWQYARDYFHDIMLGELDPTISEHDRYYDLYNLRSSDLNDFVKEETKYFELKAIEYKYKYIYERYVKINKEGGTAETEAYETTYEEKYNDAVAASTAALDKLDDLHYNLYNTRFNGTTAVSGDADYSRLSAIETDSYATKIAEVQSFLDKSNWSINATKLKAFEKEAVMTDSKLDNELDLLLAVQEFTKENCVPVVTMDVDVVDFLATKDYSVDWNKAVIGEVVNIYFPDFNIDTTAQLREITIDFQGNTLKFVISTYRQYSRLPLSYIAKQVRSSYDNSSNLFKYTHDDNKVSNERAKLVNKKLERQGFAAENAPVKFGAKSPDGSTSTEISGEGFVSKVIDVDPILETFTYTNTKTLTIADGDLLAKNVISGSITSEVEISGDNGFIIRSIDGSNNVTTQAYIDTEGNAVFGPLYINNLASSTVTYTVANGGIVATGDALNVSPGPDTRTFTLAKSVYVDNIQFVVSNFSENVLLRVDLYKGVTLVKRTTPSITGNGTVIIDNINSFINKFVFNLASVGGNAIIADSGIAANYYLPTMELNDLTISSSGQISTNEILLGEDTKDKILIKSEESASVTEPKQIILTTPTTALSADRTIRFPDASGTIALLSDLNDTNTYVTSASFNTSDGVLTLTRNDAATVTVDLDGKYAESSHEHSTSDITSGVLSATRGGTNNSFFQVSGPATSIKTFTFPNVSTTMLSIRSAPYLVYSGTGTYAFGSVGSTISLLVSTTHSAGSAGQVTLTITLDGSTNGTLWTTLATATVYNRAMVSFRGVPNTFGQIRGFGGSSTNTHAGINLENTSSNLYHRITITPTNGSAQVYNLPSTTAI